MANIQYGNLQHLQNPTMFNDTKFNVHDTRFHNTMFDGALIIIQSNWVAYFELVLHSSNEKLRLRIVIQWDCERPKEDFETGDDKIQKDGSTVRELLAMHSQRARRPFGNAPKNTFFFITMNCNCTKINEVVKYSKPLSSFGKGFQLNGNFVSNMKSCWR